MNTTTEDISLNETAVSKAILDKAGKQLQTTCKQYVENGLKLKHGQILTTPTYGKLHCKKIIHAHLPHKRSMAASGPTRHWQLIEKIINDCLQKVEDEKMTSISFPAFGLGAGGYTVEEIAEPMIKAFQAFGKSCPKYVKSIRVVIYDPDLYDKFNKFYLTFFGHNLSNPAPSPSLWQRITGSSPKVNNETQELQKSLPQASLVLTDNLSDPVTSPSLWQRITGSSPKVNTETQELQKTASQASLTAGGHSVTNSTVVFTIFAASNDKCEDTAIKLKKIVKEQCTTEKISDPCIEKLLEDDIAEILQIGDTLDIQVEIVCKIKEIHISGETSKVVKAQHDIEKVLNCIQQSEENLQFFEWKSEEEDGTYESFPKEACVRLERAYLNKKLKTIELIVEGVTVEIDLKNSTETNKTTGKKRKIKRFKETLQGMIYFTCQFSIHIFPNDFYTHVHNYYACSYYQVV